MMDIRAIVMPVAGRAQISWAPGIAPLRDEVSFPDFSDLYEKSAFDA
jgi:hypothetical protein